MMRFRLGGPLTALVATLLAAAPLHADEWELLGSRTVSYGADHDVIRVTAREGWFQSIKLEVENGNLEMWDVKVVFANGETFSPNVRLNFRENTRSRTIDLPGDKRFIQRVEFLYRSRLKRGEATVKLWGKRHPEPKGEHRAEAPAAPGGTDIRGWTKLGSRLVNFKTEKDWIEAVGEGPFRRVMLLVEGGDIEMFDMRIRFRNGEVYSPTTRFHFNTETRSRVIDLPGDLRNINRVEFTYKSIRGGGDGRATVTLYAR